MTQTLLHILQKESSNTGATKTLTRTVCYWFEKAYEDNWTQFVVSDVKNIQPPTYLLEDEKDPDIEGRFLRRREAES